MRVVAEVIGGGRHLAPALDATLGGIAEREVRAFVTDVAYGVVRHVRALEAALAPRLEAPERLPERVRLALLAGAFERLLRGTPPHAAVNSWVEVVKRGPRADRALAGLVNAVLRRIEPDDLPTPLGAACLAPWLLERLTLALGSDLAERAALGMLRPEPLWLSAPDAGAARARLADDGADVADGPIEGSLRVRAPRPLRALAAYREGLVQPQNPASLAVVQACGEVEGVRVLDLCGGHGVKAAALAARGAHVLSVERDEAKLRAAARNAQRLGVAVDALAWDLTTPPPLEPAQVVLLDAPCSGTGTLRGHPEIGLRLTPAAVASLVELQAQLLRTSLACVAPGGRLVYAVCALTPDEGPRQIERLLAEAPTFVAEAPALDLPHVATAGPGAWIVPEDGLDGFYVAALRRDG
ncbi:MAG: tRNA/rRNA cytosine-C5-methylase [Trueperaceae bacterium]|nr:MAG: tRNA/rRNA cytosine-C5-methylase [Trueperaceae bacterium]